MEAGGPDALRLSRAEVGRRLSALAEPEQIVADDVRVDGGHPRGGARRDGERAVPEELDRQWCRTGDGDDLIVAAMHHQRCPPGPPEVVGEVGSRERLGRSSLRVG